MTKKELEAISNLKDSYLASLEQIYKVCETSAEEYKSKSVPLSLVRLCVDEVKKGFNKGFKV